MNALWRDVDFRPAPVPGWRGFAFNEDGTFVFRPVVGWLVQEHFGTYVDGREEVMPLPREGYQRRVVAATHSEGWGTLVYELDLDGPVWKVVPPGTPDPGPEEVAEARARLLKLRKRDQ